MALSQEQINALLEGTGTFEPAATNASQGTALSAQEEAFFLRLADSSMQAGGAALSQVLGKTVTISHPELNLLDLNQLQGELSPTQVLIRNVYMVANQDYEALLLIKDYDVAVIFDILMGKDGRNPDLEIGDLQISAISEVINQLVGAAATHLSKEFNLKVAMEPPASQLAEMRDTSAFPRQYPGQKLLQLKYNFSIDGILDSEIYEIRTLETARLLMQILSGSPVPNGPAAAVAGGNTMTIPASAPPAMSGVSNQTSASSYSPPASQPSPQASAGHAVRAAEFAPLAAQQLAGLGGDRNLDLILDIPLRVTVELGSSRMKIKDVLELNKGSVVELEKLAGEPVDLLINGRLMAKGEVVVINENFGLRITEITGQAERLNHLRS